jgi:signal transduction histidine kinase
LAILVNNNFFLLGSGVIGAWASSTSEKMFRKDYENQQLLLNEKSELILTKEKLQEANAVKNRLISIISHDIRGPISSLAGISKMFEDRQLSESELKYFMSKMGETLDGTTIMLNNMLSWSVMQMNNTRLVKSYILLRPVIDEILLTLKAQACLKKNQLQNLVDAEIKIHSEPTLLRLVLSNLVTNAIKFTENGLIKVIASEKDNCTEISVTDTGLGMADEVSEKLFKWGSRFTREGTKKEKGSGIGLIICKDLVEKQGGRIFCESKYGHGSKFTFALPKTFEFV